MNLESTLKTNLVKELRNYGAYARRLEDRYAIGLLDLTIKFPEHPHFFAEAKIITHQQFQPTLRQYQEGKEYIEAGGVCCLIGFDKATKALFVHHWAKVAHKANSFPPGGSNEYAATLHEWLIWKTTEPSSPMLD